MSDTATTAPTVAVSERRRWGTSRRAISIFCAAALLYLPFVLTDRAIFGIPLSNMQLLNLGLTQINLMLIFMLGALSLNFLTGSAGLISIGHAAFYATGAMAGAIFGTQLGWPFPIVLICAAVLGGFVGILAGLPSLRVRGLYFVLSTLAVHHVVVFVFQEYQFRQFDVVGVPFNTPAIGGFVLDSPIRWYFFLLPIVILVYWGLHNMLSTREGRALMAMRDHELAATAVGADVRILRLKAFAVSSAIAAMAGALYAYLLSNTTSESFNIGFAIQFIAMIIIGGLGSLAGSLLGAAIWLLLPSIIAGMTSQVTGTGFISSLLVDHRSQFVQLIFGLIVILLLIFAPGGAAELGRMMKRLFSAGDGK